MRLAKIWNAENIYVYFKNYTVNLLVWSTKTPPFGAIPCILLGPYAYRLTDTWLDRYGYLNQR